MASFSIQWEALASIHDPIMDDCRTLGKALTLSLKTEEAGWGG
jgi:hypothetical protein